MLRLLPKKEADEEDEGDEEDGEEDAWSAPAVASLTRRHQEEGSSDRRRERRRRLSDASPRAGGVAEIQAGDALVDAMPPEASTGGGYTGGGTGSTALASASAARPGSSTKRVGGQEATEEKEGPESDDESDDRTAGAGAAGAGAAVMVGSRGGTTPMSKRFSYLRHDMEDTAMVDKMIRWRAGKTQHRAWRKLHKHSITVRWGLTVFAWIGILRGWHRFKGNATRGRQSKAAQASLRRSALHFMLLNIDLCY